MNIANRSVGENKSVPVFAETVSDDYLDGGEGDDVLIGDGGTDYLFGGKGNDILYGDAENDILEGGEDFDTYYYGIGDGIDFIRDSGANRLVFEFPFNLYLLQLGLGSLAIKIGDTGGEVHIEGFDPDNPNDNVAITEFAFSDGTTLSYQQLLDLGITFEGTEFNDTLIGTNAKDNLYGYAGDDLIIAKDGNDVIEGGTGNDEVFGDAGNDGDYVGLAA